MSAKKEFGDFQTPTGLAERVVALVATIYGEPDVVVEPTAGLGAFLGASFERWGENTSYFGYEVNQAYVQHAKKKLKDTNIRIYHRDFFSENWLKNLSHQGANSVLVIGNPPWVTNSDLGQLGSMNLPEKKNFMGLRGMDARTGKSNFDIAEWMLIRLIEALPETGGLAMLCKTMTARKVLKHLWKNDYGRKDSKLFHINAKSEFDVAVDACLFYISGKRCDKRLATVYSDLDLASEEKSFGYIDGDLVSDISGYKLSKHIDGGSSSYIWRSGIKHDASKVMEFTVSGESMTNGFGETVDIESDYVYPLLKSSDIGNGRIAIRKAVLIPQKHTGEDTSVISSKAPATWNYLLSYANILDARRSSIYKNRPRFSIFGVGPYSFSPWKVAISGLYKRISFSILGPHNGRSIMVDDTCYSIPCRSETEAQFVCELLSSEIAKQFLQSLIFMDAKRPITIDVLKRVSFVELAKSLGRLGELEHYIQEGSNDLDIISEPQMRLVMEPQKRYRTRRSSQRLGCA